MRAGGRAGRVGCRGGAFFAVLLALLLPSLTACGLRMRESAQGSGGGYAETGFLPATPGNYDSTDTAVLISKDTAASRITLLNLELGRRYTLDYDGATAYADKYGQALSLQQVLPGSIVEVRFMHARKRLDTMQIAPQAFVSEHVRSYEILPNGRSIVIGGESYTLAPEVVVATPEGTAELMDIDPVDVLRVTGIGHTIYGLYVEQGHGYLRLENAEYFAGGWLQVGDGIVKQVANEMLVAVPEGTHTVTVSKRGSVGTDEITLARGAEVTLDASVWVSEPQYGRIVFTAIPENARIYIDGEVIDNSEEQVLSYGIHQMVATADGYETVSRYVRVAQELANLNVILERDGSAVSVSGNDAASGGSGERTEPSASGNDASGQTVSGNDAPGGASGNDVTEQTVSGNDVPGGASGNDVIEQAVSGNDALGSASGNDAAEQTVSGNDAPGSVSGNDASAGEALTIGQYRVYIDAPEGVEVYKDGTYLGICPVSFPRAAGSYVITLRQNGYQTRSYSITVDGAEQDANYSFSELLPIS